MQVVPGIEYVDETSPAHVYVLDDGGALTLIDAGHLCFYLPERRVLFTGDAILNRGGLSGPVPQYTADVAQAHEALRQKIAPLAVETRCVAHGEAIRAGAGPHLRQDLAALA